MTGVTAAAQTVPLSGQFEYTPERAKAAEDARKKRRFANVVKRLCRHRTELVDAARNEMIEPRHMVSCLLSEHFFLKNVADDLVDAAAFTGHYLDPSLGLTQIKLSTARPIANELYDQPISDQYIIYDLLNSKTAVKYMARLLGNIIDDYRKSGFDISNATGVVCSSYLVGNSRARAEAHRRDKTVPVLNYYGIYAREHRTTADAIISGAACR